MVSDRFKKLEAQMEKMIQQILDDQGDLQSSKLVGLYVTKKKLHNKPDVLISLMPKLVKVLFEFGELELCEEILKEGVSVFPNDEKLKNRLAKIQKLLNYNVIQESTPVKEESKEDGIDYAGFDLENEISKIEENANVTFVPQSVPNKNVHQESSIFSDQTIVSPDSQNSPLSERTLIPQGKEVSNNSITNVPTPPMINSDVEEGHELSLHNEYPGLKLLSERYEYDKVLGEGGMGGVFLARDKQLERKVAIKFMNASCMKSSDVAERFIREARATAVASHPGIVAIYDVGSESNPFIVMENVEGVTVKDGIKESGGYSLKESKNIMRMIAEALHYAHDKGIIHRDVKPDNIILDKFGQTKLLDFGLAKMEEMPSMTIENQIMGTPYYMAPEQITGGEIGPCTDIYAWGAMFFQLITGLVPFLRGDIMYHHVNTEPPLPSSLALDIPPKLEELVMNCLAKSVENRYSDFQEVLNDLKKIHF